jgi:hypothetical protein
MQSLCESGQAYRLLAIVGKSDRGNSFVVVWSSVYYTAVPLKY